MSGEKKDDSKWEHAIVAVSASNGIKIYKYKKPREVRWDLGDVGAEITLVPC